MNRVVCTVHVALLMARPDVVDSYQQQRCQRHGTFRPVPMMSSLSFEMQITRPVDAFELMTSRRKSSCVVL